MSMRLFLARQDLLMMGVMGFVEDAVPQDYCPLNGQLTALRFLV